MKSIIAILIAALLTGCLTESKSPRDNRLLVDKVTPSDTLKVVDSIIPVNSIIPVDSTIIVDSTLSTDSIKPDFGVKLEAGTYSLYGDTMVLLADITYSSYCNGNTLVNSINESNLPDTLLISVRNNSLAIYFSTEFDTLESGAIVMMYSRYARVGSGAGLEGGWRIANLAFDVISGLPSVEEKALIASRSAYYVAGSKQITVLFKDGNYTVYHNGKTAEVFLDRWNRVRVSPVKDESGQNYESSDSASFDITVKVVGLNTVELYGHQTMETVSLQISPEGNVTYTSDNPDHASHTFMENPISCPNEWAPAWYDDFENDNRKTPNELFKSGQIPPKSPPVHKSSHFPLNPGPSFLN